MNFKKKKEKKAQLGIGDLKAVAVVFVLTGLIIVFGLQIVGDVQDDLTANSAEYNASADVIEGTSTFPEKFGILATIVIASIIIGLLIRSFGKN